MTASEEVAYCHCQKLDLGCAEQSACEWCVNNSPNFSNAKKLEEGLCTPYYLLLFFSDVW